MADATEQLDAAAGQQNVVDDGPKKLHGPVARLALQRVAPKVFVLRCDRLIPHDQELAERVDDVALR